MTTTTVFFAIDVARHGVEDRLRGVVDRRHCAVVERAHLGLVARVCRRVVTEPDGLVVLVPAAVRVIGEAPVVGRRGGVGEVRGREEDDEEERAAALELAHRADGVASEHRGVGGVVHLAHDGEGRAAEARVQERHERGLAFERTLPDELPEVELRDVHEAEAEIDAREHVARVVARRRRWRTPREPGAPAGRRSRAPAPPSAGTSSGCRGDADAGP